MDLEWFLIASGRHVHLLIIFGAWKHVQCFSSLSLRKIVQKRTLTNLSRFIGFWSQLIICFSMWNLGVSNFPPGNAFWNSFL